jgi:hypothetical protein
MKNTRFHYLTHVLGLCAALAGFIAAAPSAQAAPADFGGVWANMDPGTDHILRFTIVPFKAGPVISVSGKCTPTPCNWGSMPLTTYGNSVSDANHKHATTLYNFGFATAAMTFQLLDAQTMVVHTYTQFLDHSGRQNYHKVERFRKLPIVIDPAPGF